jgi:hypothetical protein
MANPKISTVIMTGGGNDVMFTAGSCSTPDACAMMGDKIIDALNVLWTKMADDGVKDVIYVEYSDDAGTTPKANRGMSTKQVEVCFSGRISCHTLATTDLVMAQLLDGIHPTDPANDRIVAALLKMMEMRGIRR